MKALFKISLFTLVLGVVFSFKPVETLKSATVVIKTTVYCDHCKECETCRPLIEEKLFLEKGIREVVLDEKAMTVTVTYNPKKTSPDQIRKAISKLGYDADEVKADPSGYEKLDGCCKKP